MLALGRCQIQATCRLCRRRADLVASAPPNPRARGSGEVHPMSRQKPEVFLLEDVLGHGSKDDESGSWNVGRVLVEGIGIADELARGMDEEPAWTVAAWTVRRRFQV